MLKKYEITIVFDSDLDNQGVNQQLEKVEALIASHDGSIEKQDIWGRRQLAYPINKKNYGSYVVLVASANGTLVADLRRQLRINDQVLRSLVVNKDKYAPDLPKDWRDDGNDRAFGRHLSGDGADDDIATLDI